MNHLVIIPHWGTNAHLVKLLPSLGVEFPGDEALEDSRLIIPFKFGEIFIWCNNIRNLGFTKACNEGIRYGLNQGFDSLLLLNNDTEVENFVELFEGIEKEFTENPKTGIIGFKNLAMDDTDWIFHGGTGAAFPAGVHKVGHVSNGDLNVRTKEKWVTGASLAISSGCAMEIGTMDENFVNYGSDSDYCYVARSAGFDVVYLPIAIKHVIGQSANPSDAQMKVIKSDMLYFANKWISGRRFYDLDSEQV